MTENNLRNIMVQKSHEYIPCCIVNLSNFEDDKNIFLKSRPVQSLSVYMYCSYVSLMVTDWQTLSKFYMYFFELSPPKQLK